MLQTKLASQAYHQATNHSPLSVKLDPNYVDASTQPSVYKVYPQFYRRFNLEDDNPVHSLIQLTSAITLEKIEKNCRISSSLF